jgi:LuxR family maltose regulon positive regulatory protein
VHQQLVSAQRLWPELTYTFPHVAIQARPELARVYITLADLAGAQTLMREIDELLRRRPASAPWPARARRSGPSWPRRARFQRPRSLGAAELRLLTLLSTHLAFPEVAGELSLSRNTVKSQANSIYRKLGASSRSRAVVAWSRELGAADGWSFIPSR